MNLPLTKHTALLANICKVMRKDPLTFGTQARAILEAMPESDYDYFYALFWQRKFDELRDYLQPYAQ